MSRSHFDTNHQRDLGLDVMNTITALALLASWVLLNVFFGAGGG